jgi:alkanesulfonate monooxygenase
MRLFAISPRTRDPDVAWTAIDTTIRLADRYGFTGVLAHTGNDTLMDPWLVGQHALHTSPRLQPLIAVNPVYHHPFAAAQLAASLTYRYQRRLFLNLVIGTSVPDRVALGDETEHDQRYRRLTEYGQIVLGLCGTTAPLSRDGEFYRLRGARLALPGPAQLRPVPFIAGHSPMARKCAADLGAVRIQMFSQDVPTVGEALGEYAGLLARGTDEEAWAVAGERYPADPDLEAAGAAALRYTDASWRHETAGAAARPRPPAPAWYWSWPMRSMQADCPLLVGGVDTLAPAISAHRAAGTGTFIFDLAAQEEDFAWAARVIERSARP